MLNTLTLRPAYGRKYKTMQEALTDWNNGKDFFITETNCYCSIRDSLMFRRQMYLVWLVVGSDKFCVTK